MKLKKGDNIIVITGKDKGKSGKIVHVLVKENKVDGIVVAACALKRLHLDAEIKDIFPWEGMPLQGRLAVVGRRHDHELENIFKVIDARCSFGKVF